MTYRYALTYQRNLEASAQERRVRKRFSPQTIFLALLSVASVVHIGCAPADSFVDAPTLDESLETPETSEDQSEVDESATPIVHESLSNEAILGLLKEHRYRDEGFVLVNSEPFVSTVSPTKTIILWVSEGGYGSFTRIDPDRSGSLSSVPEGTIVIREVLASGVLETITVMAKLREGAFPLGGDFWYASANPDGSIRMDDNGAPLAGLLQNCGTCHLRRNRDGFLFGAPTDSLP